MSFLGVVTHGLWGGDGTDGDITNIYFELPIEGKYVNELNYEGNYQNELNYEGYVVIEKEQTVLGNYEDELNYEGKYVKELKFDGEYDG